MTDNGPSENVDRVEAIVAFLRSEGAERLGHAGGRTLLDHLRGTAAVIARWGQPAWLQHAALVHSVYGTDAYAHQLIAPARRVELAALAGERAERLAYLFCVTPRGPLLAGTLRWARGLAPRRLDGEPENEGGQPAARGELDALVLLHMANLADQACAADGSPGRWLVRLRDLGALLADSEIIAAPGCLAWLAGLTDEDESLARRSYARGAVGDDAGRVSALALAAAACPVIAEPCLWLAHLARSRGDAGEARSWAIQARARLELLGAAWDKRVSFEEWLAICDSLEHGADAAVRSESPSVSDPRALLDLSSGVAAGPPGVRAPADATGSPRFLRYVERLADAVAPSAGGAYPDLPSRAWHDPRGFALVDELEASFPAIRAEIMALDHTAFHRESERIGRSGNWDVAFLYERGRRHDDVCAACPVTARTVERHRTIRSIAGLIYVSRMRPGTHIAPHRGPTNLRLRCHLAIAVPDGDCAIRVGTQTEPWREGRCLVFDDFYDHEAWNHTAEDRIVLIVDLWHPGLSDAEVRLLEGLHAYTYRHARRLSRYWSSNEAAARETDREQSTWA